MGQLTQKIWPIIIGSLDAILLVAISWTSYVDPITKIIATIVGIIIAWFVVKEIKKRIEIRVLELEEMKHKNEKARIERDEAIKKKYNI